MFQTLAPDISHNWVIGQRVSGKNQSSHFFQTIAPPHLPVELARLSIEHKYTPTPSPNAPSAFMCTQKSSSQFSP